MSASLTRISTHTQRTSTIFFKPGEGWQESLALGLKQTPSQKQALHSIRTSYFEPSAVIALLIKMQGFNMGRYVPPEHEGVTSANKLASKHPLGARAHKASQGILTVRFEMPFPIWCTTCQPKPIIIGQGVRFNAEKKKVGNYYSTPIYSFRMKHTVCGGWIEIRTDPKNTAYVVTRGAKKRDTGVDKEVEGEIEIRTAEERERLENDAFAKLEGKVEDKQRQVSEKGRLEELQRAQEKDWADPYEASRKLRRTFRADRKTRKGNARATEALQDKMSLGMELLEESEGDRLRARLVDFAPATGPSRAKGLFNKPRPVQSPRKKDKGKRGRAEDIATARRIRLHEELSDNTRVLIDPFVNDSNAWEVAVKERKIESERQATQPGLAALVDYESD